MTRRTITTILFAILASYSLTLALAEGIVSQDYVRLYFTDIRGSVTFYAVNTTLCVVLIWGAALLFLVSNELAARSGAPRRERMFLILQALLLIYLGFDERFLFHEHLGKRLGVNDAWILTALGLFELVVLFVFGRLHTQHRRLLIWVGAAGVLFGLMVLVDAFAPSRAFLRLTVEDLLKFWAIVCLFAFAWRNMTDRLNLFEPCGRIRSASS